MEKEKRRGDDEGRKDRGRCLKGNRKGKAEVQIKREREAVEPKQFEKFLLSLDNHDQFYLVFKVKP